MLDFMKKNKNIGERLEKFINICGFKHKDIAKIFDITPNYVGKYINGTLNIDNIAEKLNKIGCDLNWLYTGIGNMFADNAAGKKLSDKFNTVIDDSMRIKYERALQWINRNYRNLKLFIDEFNLNQEQWQDLLLNFKASSKASFELSKIMNEAGCNLYWLDTGEDSEYNNEYRGVVLKEKLISGKIDENEIQKRKGNLNKEDLKNTIIEIKEILKEILLELKKER
jgi:predicted transcriptional regulator